MKVAIAFSTKDRVELSKRTIEPLHNGQHALFWIDGSTTDEGETLPLNYAVTNGGLFHNVRGGADAAIVFALTKMLAHPANYTHVGLVENDVLLHKDWFGPTMALFERGAAEGLSVGAVSPRCFDDRILFQRDGYAVCHNLGAGAVIFTRQAARSILDNYRTGWTMENRRVFAQLSGIDIAKYWCFRGGQHWTTADWSFDTILASIGYASLALTPSPVEMIGQVPSLAEQGLKLVTEPVELLRNDKAFELFAHRTRNVRDHIIALSNQTAFHQADDGSWTYFPHQIADLGGGYFGDWRLKWAQGFGPFAYRAGNDQRKPVSEITHPPDELVQAPTLIVPISGSCSFLVSGGANGGQVEIEDLASGYKVSPELAPEGQTGQVMQLMVPAGVSYRDVKLTALTPGIVFYGLQTHEPQPWLPGETFDWSKLPPV